MRAHIARVLGLCVAMLLGGCGGDGTAPSLPAITSGNGTHVTVAFATNAHVSGSQAAGFSMVGNQPRTFTVTAQDAEGNTIVGAPTFTVTSGSSAVAIASTATAGTYTAQVQSFSNAPVQLTATPSNGAAVHVQVTTVQELWVGNSGGNSVTAYNASTGAQLSGDTITGLSAPFMIQTGPNGDLWLSNFAGYNIEEVVPETNTALLTIGGAFSDISGPLGIAFDGAGNLYLCLRALNEIGKYSAASFAGLTGSQDIGPVASGTGNVGEPYQSAFDSSGTLWVAENVSSAVTAYNSSLNNVASIVGDNTTLVGPTGIGFDAAGHLWVADNISDTIDEYSTSGVTLTNTNISPLTSIAGGSTGLNGPVGIAFDAAGNLWAANRGVSSVTEYAAGSVGAGGNLAPLTTITAGLSQASGLTFTP